ncbi:xanthine dehydrogenase small subunit [Cohaesibacter celericrescens]|uniref:Xanthine dehydrogenase small subunit n=1 Tax=Cohaesibacter celericrescens TaxID=2067669 RepID=A0A2N5XWC3_9HYPH|nr:xanthine dehydrogenase small subunit [Cohaesibacter celericrescens]PLW78813.1 xanthine dehydrogenase small subunit [Cohaesibacter celericrescens]
MPSIRDEVSFWLNDQLITRSAFSPCETLLDFLRLNQRLTGSKEGCAEGDCGACTVLVGRLYRGGLIYETVNSCIRFLPSLDGCHVVTIEALKGQNGALHPVQQAMVDHHGSQCGFCTPGIVMSLYALWMEVPQPNRQQVETALQGNLCRCTGYAPILKAAAAISDYGTPASDWLENERNVNFDRLADLKHGDRVVIEKDGQRAILPANLDDFSHVRLDEPDATIVAGSTDVGLWVTKNMRALDVMVFVGHLEEMKEISCAKPYITLGAGATYSEAQDAVVEHFAHLKDFWNRIAGQQIRNMGTIGGNIANGSPIGDLPPVFIALGADVILRRGWEERRVPLEQFFIAYGKQNREQGDFVKAIRIPLMQDSSHHAAYKISKRRDEDISSVCVAFNLTVEDGVISKARIAFGGMAGTPKRAEHCEARLIGQPFCEASLVAAGACLDEDFTPLSDWRASDVYRMKVAKNLFRRFWLDQIDGQPEQEAAQ